MKLYWPIDQLIDSYIDWSFTVPSWDGRGLTSGLIQYGPIQYSLCFFVLFFLHMQIFVAQRGQKKNNRDPHESIIAVIQWLSMNSKCVCHCLWGTGLKGFKWGFEVQHCHLWTGRDAAGCRHITSSCWGHWCVFLRCCLSDKEKQGQLCSVQEWNIRESLKEVYVDVYKKEKAHQKF